MANLRGRNYRLVKDQLDRDIVPGESKVKVKGDRVTVQLRKVRRGTGGGLVLFVASLFLHSEARET